MLFFLFGVTYFQILVMNLFHYFKMFIVLLLVDEDKTQRYWQEVSLVEILEEQNICAFSAQMKLHMIIILGFNEKDSQHLCDALLT